MECVFYWKTLLNAFHSMFINFHKISCVECFDMVDKKHVKECRHLLLLLLHVKQKKCCFMIKQTMGFRFRWPSFKLIQFNDIHDHGKEILLCSTWRLLSIKKKIDRQFFLLNSIMMTCWWVGDMLNYEPDPILIGLINKITQKIK